MQLSLRDRLLPCTSPRVEKVKQIHGLWIQLCYSLTSCSLNFSELPKRENDRMPRAQACQKAEKNAQELPGT